MDYQRYGNLCSQRTWSAVGACRRGGESSPHAGADTIVFTALVPRFRPPAL